MAEVPKAYEPKAVEEKWYQFWLDQNCFTADPHSSKPAYSIVIPPPNVTGMLHMGHVLNNTIQDILSRKARMDGKEVLWLPGTDHAGIATQAVVEKSLQKQKVIRHRDDLGREKFLEHVWSWKEKHGGIIIQQLKKLGCSCDWTRERFTMDPEYSKCVQEVFVELYKKGFIYRGKRMVNWDPLARTALSDEEVEMIEEKGQLWHLKYPLLDDNGQPLRNEFVVVATTRPETMLGDEAVAVNPKDSRYTNIVGRKCLLPLQNKAIPIIADDFVDPKFGTGCVKVTPAHDPNDYQMGVRHNLPFTIVIGPDGKMTREASEDFIGLDRMEARKAVVEELTEQGLLLKTEDYVHSVGYSQRSHVPIEPYLSEQWFMKYPSVDASTKAVEEGKIQFHPERWTKTYTHWMHNIKDWCISRQLWWGHRVPVWYHKHIWPQRNREVRVTPLTGQELAGENIHELRNAAWKFAEEHQLLNRTFRNQDTGWDILVRTASLEHAFTHRGAANIKAVAALPQLIASAVKLGTEPHEPPNEYFRFVHSFAAALRIGSELFQVKITVKEHVDGHKLYDHAVFKEGAPDGKSLMPAAVSSLQTQPTSSATLSIGDLFASVNRGEGILRCQLESPGPDWEQDPDVLDTWASSWLWPFATMGWPDKTDTLKKFYPTTDLVTGPDIIFFWVARMIMAGYEFMGELPFRNVYFTGIIRDKLGRKMSKSLGNSPDPLVLIDKYGADALRFGTMRSAPLGQDVLFDEKDVELGRNFCNKLWNACRFRQMQGGEVQAEIDRMLLTTDDKWVLLKLDTAIREITTAFAEYKFNEAAQVLYRFFWSEYCDWYVEASKAVLSKPAAPKETAPVWTAVAERSGDTALSKPSAAIDEEKRRANKLAVIDFVLSHTLRLFHPFLPFITEELWHGMGFNVDMPDNQGGKTIMYAPWPKPLDEDFRGHYGLDDCYVEMVEAKYDLVRKGRDLRREANIPASKKVRYLFKPTQDLPPYEQEVIRLLLNAETLDVKRDYEPPKGTPSFRSEMGELFLPLEGMVDVAAEKARLTKELQKVETEIVKVKERLSNPGFTQKVPPAVLQEHQQRLADWETKQAHLTASLQALG